MKSINAYNDKKTFFPRRVARLGGLALLSGIFFWGCNSDDQDTGPMAPETPMEETRTIAEIAASNSDFETLTAALTAAGLVETLQGAGPFTVFAPTDEAFAALPEGTLETLLAEPEGMLKDILLYHVVSGEVPAATVVGLTEATTVNGAKVSIAVEDGSVILNGSVKVTATDIEASNGLIHVIDAVLIP